MKQSKLKLRLQKNVRLIRTEYERDYDHPVWQTHSILEATPQTYPDAFYKIVVPIDPQFTPVETRLVPHVSLSKRQIRKRLYAAGVPTNKISRIAAEIKDGPPVLMGEIGYCALGWNVKLLQETYGSAIARKLRRFVEHRFVLIDEFSQVVNNAAIAQYTSHCMKMFRKTNSMPAVVTQSLADVMVDVNQRT